MKKIFIALIMGIVVCASAVVAPTLSFAQSNPNLIPCERYANAARIPARCQGMNNPEYRYLIQTGVLSDPNGFTPIVSLPGINTNASGATIGQYVNAVFQLAIGIGAILAVVMLIIGGFEYMTQDAIASQSKGKERIQGALIGAILLLLVYLIIYIVDPRILQSIDRIQDRLSGLSGGGARPFNFSNLTGDSINLDAYRILDLGTVSPEAAQAFSRECAAQSSARRPASIVCIDDDYVVQNNPSCFDPSGARRYRQVMACYR